MPKNLSTIFEQHFNTKAKYLIQTPGRVNLIGEHTDYNNGFVFPMAIDRYLWLALSPRDDNMVNVFSIEYNEKETFWLNDLHPGIQNKKWIEYIKGVAWVLQNSFGELNGWDGVIHGNIPQGAGLSSSAALEITTARAFATVANIEWNGAKMAQLCQKAENEWIHVNCGIMDQMIVALGKSNHALLIDCQNLMTEQVPMPKGATIVIMDTMTRRELVSSAYNERRMQCEGAANILGAKSLREITVAAWEKDHHILTDKMLMRARHVVTENQRVIAAKNAMQKHDSATLGELMNASHESLKNDFEVSSENLDVMVDLARSSVGCYGARMTGAGFGGCAVALVKEMYTDDFVYQVVEGYEKITKIRPNLYVTLATNGVTVKEI